MVSLRSFLVLVLLVSVTLAVRTLLRRAPIWAEGPAPVPVLRSGGSALKRELQGTASCSASVCHGGSAIGQRLSEATTWRALDPHARAYDTLLISESQAIAKNMWGDKLSAHEAPLCLNCHVHPSYERARPNFRKEDGVGCESCHGAAQDWIGP